ncbi:hypothetical protein TELCIR_23557 [Teladorsagia circumcincta]|uniref:Uncharacterized protein n=1 Tax=Teladorsagia circumcincta TaxID=45464 RepID=A0A2G9TAS0_TELCI|nr:hypothetical protein TELCIR_23557 [Teladorsagia circumcincta]
MWKVLRDNYRRNAVYKIGVNSKKQWFFAKYLRFLDHVDVQGNSISNLDNGLKLVNGELVDSASPSSVEAEKLRRRKRLAEEGTHCEFCPAKQFHLFRVG